MQKIRLFQKNGRDYDGTGYIDMSEDAINLLKRGYVKMPDKIPIPEALDLNAPLEASVSVTYSTYYPIYSSEGDLEGVYTI